MEIKLLKRKKTFIKILCISISANKLNALENFTKPLNRKKIIVCCMDDETIS